MSIKILAIDLDDTLLSEDLTISIENIRAIKAIKEEGVRIVLCSGRTRDSMMPYSLQLGSYQEDDYIVSYNGAVIHQMNGHKIFEKVIDGKDLEDLIDIGREFEIDTQLYTDTLMVEKITDKTIRYEYLTGMKAMVVEDLKVVRNSIKVLYNHEAGDELEALRQKIVNVMDHKCNVFYSKPMYIEVLNKEANKGLALEYIVKLLGMDRSEVMAIGDGFNDVSMIEFAGIGIAVKNAPKDVRCCADYVTENDHNHHVIAEIYERFHQLFPGK